VFVRPATLAPGLEQFGWTDLRAAADQGLSPHRHEKLIEICVVVRGLVRWWAVDQWWDVGPGDVYLTAPDEPHGGMNDMLQPCELYWLQLHPGRLGRAMKSLGLGDGTTVDRLVSPARRCFPGGDALVADLRRMHEAMRRGVELDRLAVAGALLAFLARVLRRHDDALIEQAVEPGRCTSELMRRAMLWMDARLTEDFAIAEAADAVGYSVTRFHERFRAETGFSPADWRARQRLARGKRLLRETRMPVSQIAQRCGFSTSQYFATVLRRYEGVSPTQFRRGGGDPGPRPA